MYKQMGMFDPPSSTRAVKSKLVELTGMEWAPQGDDSWIAQGRRGRFVLWKEKRRWRGRYINRVDTYWFDLPHGLSLDKLKGVCENNRYWERPKCQR